MAVEGSGYGPDGIYHSPRPPIQLPEDPHMDLVSFLFHNIHAAGLANKTAVVDAATGQALTYSELKQNIQSVAAGLASLGVSRGHVVLILSPNSIHFAVLFLAVVSIGAIVTTVNPVYTTREIAKQIKDSGTKFISTVPELLNKVQNARLPVILIGESELRDENVVALYSELLSTDPRNAPQPQIRQTDTAALLYSSGTTGVSKGVIISHRNFMAAALQVAVDVQLLGIKDQIYLCMLPMFHVFALVGIFYTTLQSGETLMIMAKFEFELMLEAIQKYRVTCLPTVPPVCIALAKQKAVEKYDLSSLQEIISGAAPLGKEIMEECSLKLPTSLLSQGYGLTETTGIASLYRRPQHKEHFGTVGLLCSSMEAKIVDIESGKPLSPTKQGELWLRGPNIMQGYLNNKEATESTLDKEGWLHTGDVGYFNDVGLLFIVDRLKELIKYKGLQVAPAELEALLLSNPFILDAAVVPFPDDTAGQVPHAFVVLSPDKQLFESDVVKFVADKVAPFKRLRKVTFVTSIPKSPSGKILRRQLIQHPVAKL
ncbi:hypothetical protein O6H91_11G008200 [Diphasiastrum complanatum]|uniref:Uncharacterized protein n=1 Tax=Diphasiastrum complanatum TaxID=34168 RepID=A0ACC2C7B8_DIPCM|nr:hypothetical protein O6H91_11G008200 [Diphasiastrum complanatum]